MNIIKKIKHKYLGTEYVWIEDNSGKTWLCRVRENELGTKFATAGSRIDPTSTRFRLHDGGYVTPWSTLYRWNPYRTEQEEQAWAVVGGLGAQPQPDEMKYHKGPLRIYWLNLDSN